MEWDKSLATEAGINECRACWSCVEGLAGLVPILHTYLLQQSLPNHSKHWKFAKIFGWSHHMNIQNKWRKKSLNLSTYQLLSKTQPRTWFYGRIPLCHLAEMLLSSLMLICTVPYPWRRNSFHNLCLVPHLAAFQVWAVEKFSSASSSSENERYIHLYM